MSELPPDRSLLLGEFPADLVVILDRARDMQRRGWHPALHARLRGKKLGLISVSDSAERSLFADVAEALGADVIRVPSPLSTVQSLWEIQRTAHVLGMFYDAVNCEGLSADLVHLLQIHALTPVFDDLCSNRHDVARVAALLDPTCSLEENRRWAVMSALAFALE